MAKVTLMKREPTHLQIAHRAFEIYVSRGGHHGHDVGDWFEAERQLRTPLRDLRRVRRHGRRAPGAASSRRRRHLTRAIHDGLHRKSDTGIEVQRDP